MGRYYNFYDTESFFSLIYKGILVDDSMLVSVKTIEKIEQKLKYRNYPFPDQNDFFENLSNAYNKFKENKHSIIIYTPTIYEKVMKQIKNFIPEDKQAIEEIVYAYTCDCGKYADEIVFHTTKLSSAIIANLFFGEDMIVLEN